MIKKFNCRLCGSFSAKKHFRISNEDIVYKCTTCGFVQIPIPPIDKLDSSAAINSRNQDEFRQTGAGDNVHNNKSDLPPILRKLAHVIEEDGRRITEFIKEFLNKIKIEKSSQIEFIDIGSGYGNNSFLLKKEIPNLNITLLEISKERIEMGIDAFSPNLNDFTFCHELLDAEFSKKHFEKFDITFSFHVLEHVFDIINFIKNTFSIIKPGGFAILEVPNQNDDLQELSSNYKKIIHFPSHVNYFNKNTLQRLLDVSGISDKSTTTFIPIQRYGFFNYIDWIRYNSKKGIISDDYAQRANKSWIEKLWLKEKQDNSTTDSLMIVLKKEDKSLAT